MTTFQTSRESEGQAQPSEECCDSDCNGLCIKWTIHFRQAESLKANLLESGRSVSESGKAVLEGGKAASEAGKGLSDLWVTRQKLEDVYKHLLLMDLEYALDKKVEQDL